PVLSMLICSTLIVGNAAAAGPEELTNLLASELDYSMQNLVSSDGMRPYYLAYTITDMASCAMVAQSGAIYQRDQSHSRALDVDLRVGDYTLDNTHQIRGGRDFGGGGGGGLISLEDNPVAISHALWQATDREFRNALERYQRVLTNQKTMVEEQAPASDFSHESPSVHVEEDVLLDLDTAIWVDRLRSVSKLACQYPQVYESQVALSASSENRVMVDSEGTRLKTGRKLLRVIVSASTKADDGMDLSQSFIFDAATEDKLPTEEQIRTAFQNVIDMVLALRTAPLVEPYTGPAILMNRASGVFFHEIFGHRIEGHRQKDVNEGQTFAKMIGQSVLPDFMGVTDDPTRATFDGQDLRGFYRYDDEGVPSQRVPLVENGILKTFLLSRSPLPGFDRSNGHGRRSPGNDVVSR
ncbi:MAG TPA: metallopeptidase TldD-related protein, partial [Gammaproteobacteria bacterium]|nr:metallopeptidase TldD-related protein [Gammaproteobacteria bacterium]